MFASFTKVEEEIATFSWLAQKEQSAPLFHSKPLEKGTSHFLLAHLRKNPEWSPNLSKWAKNSRKVRDWPSLVLRRDPSTGPWRVSLRVSLTQPRPLCTHYVSPRCIARFYGLSSGKRTPRFLTKPRGLRFNTCVIVLIVCNCWETSLLIATFYG